MSFLRLTSAFLLVAVAGCGSRPTEIVDGGDPPPETPELDAGTPDASSQPPITRDFTLSLGAPSVSVAAGATGRVEVRIERLGGLTAEVTIDVTGLPTGVTAAALQIGATETRGELVFNAARDATPGKITVEVRGSTGARSHQVPLEMTISPPSGSLDLTYGAGGRRSFSFNGASAAAADAVMLPGDKVLILTDDNLLVQLTSSGELDPTFGTDGQASIPLSHGSVIAVRPDGRIVVAGLVSGATDSVAAVCQLTATGAVDSTFGTAGTTEIPGINDHLRAVAIDGDGKVLVAGVVSTTIYIDGPVAVARLDAQGAIDNTFGTKGIGASTFKGTPRALVVRKSGQIAVAGIAAGYPHGFQLVQFTPTGAVDVSFGYKGRATVGFDVSYATDLVERPDGKLLTVGAANCDSSFNGSKIGVAQFDATGHLDGTFVPGGSLALNVRTRFDTAFDVALLPDGRFLIAGESMVDGPPLDSAQGADSQYDGLVARFTPHGELDTSFGVGGFVTDDFGLTQQYEHFMKVMVQSDGKLLAVGTRTTRCCSELELYTARFYP